MASLVHHLSIPFALPVTSPQRIPPPPPSSLRIRAQSALVNPGIKKDESKVVDTVVVSELEKPLQAFCRCWRSGSFPLCDGSHAKHNKETGDNVGPLLVKK